MDLSSDKLKSLASKKPLLIKPNHHEMREIFGVPVNTDDAVSYTHLDVYKRQVEIPAEVYPAEHVRDARAWVLVLPYFEKAAGQDRLPQ